MVEALSRRRFLALLAAGMSAPALACCSAQRVPALRVPSRRTTKVLPALAGNGIRPQVVTPLPGVSSWAPQPRLGISDLPAGNPDHLLVLSYHNVTLDGRQPGRSLPDPFTVSAADFAAQLQMLSLAGFRSVRIADVLAARQGRRPLPPRSLLITFDDGGDGQWVYADRVLAEVGYSAASFVITGHLGSSAAYMTWPEAEALAATGRWDVEAHTHDQHHFVTTGPGRRPASVLINRIWDPVTRRLEPAVSARRRVEDDLADSLDVLSGMGFAPPKAFAYPFSQVGGPTNDQTLATHVAGLLHATFPLLFSNSSPGRMAQPDEVHEGFLPRMEVRRGMSALNLFERIRAADVPEGAEHSPDERFGG